MIKARFVCRRGGMGLELDGHSGQAAKGQDLVCAAVSTLAFALAGFMKGKEAEGGLRLKNCELLPGRARISVEAEGAREREAAAVFELAEYFAALLSEYFPGNILVEKSGRPWGRERKQQ